MYFFLRILFRSFTILSNLSKHSDFILRKKSQKWSLFSWFHDVNFNLTTLFSLPVVSGLFIFFKKKLFLNSEFTSEFEGKTTELYGEKLFSPGFFPYSRSLSFSVELPLCLQFNYFESRHAPLRARACSNVTSHVGNVARSC